MEKIITLDCISLVPLSHRSASPMSFLFFNFVLIINEDYENSTVLLLSYSLEKARYTYLPKMNNNLEFLSLFLLSLTALRWSLKNILID